MTKVPRMSTRPAETERPPVELMLRSLPAQHQEIIIATYFRHRTTDEAARHLGLAPGAAKARLYQAMRDLSSMVATGWPDRADVSMPVADGAGRGKDACTAW